MYTVQKIQIRDILKSCRKNGPVPIDSDEREEKGEKRDRYIVEIMEKFEGI